MVRWLAMNGLCRAEPSTAKKKKKKSGDTLKAHEWLAVADHSIDRNSNRNSLSTVLTDPPNSIAALWVVTEEEGEEVEDLPPHKE